MKRTKFLIEETLTTKQHATLWRQDDAGTLISVYREVEGYVSTKRFTKRKPLTIPIIAERTGIDVKRVQRAFRRLNYLLYIKP